MTKTTVFTLHEKDVTAKKAGRNVTTHAQHRIIYFCIILSKQVIGKRCGSDQIFVDATGYSLSISF